MPRVCERSRRISDSVGSLNRLREKIILVAACKVSKTIINNDFKAHALQRINYVKLVTNNCLDYEVRPESTEVDRCSCVI